MTEIGLPAASLPHDSDEDLDTPSKGICLSSEDLSRFASKAQFIKLCTMVAPGRHYRGFDMART